MNGVIQTNTGYLLRSGYVNFLIDGSFDPETQTYKTDVPEINYILDPNNILVTQWTGITWIEIPFEDTVTLDECKAAKYIAIDTKTEQLIRLGFTFDGHAFSMSINAQINWSNFPNLPDVLFPLSIMDINDEVYVLSLANKINFYLSALNYKNDQLQSGSILKSQVKACADKACVNSIIDNR